MDVRYINPFIAATVNALKIMAGVEVTRDTPFIKGSFQSLADVSGIIDLSGSIRGAVVLSFPFPLAGRIYQSLTGESPKEGDPAIGDVVGELANMVAGGSKAALTELGLDFRLGIPSIVMGPNHSIATKIDAPCLVIPFQLGQEPFWVQVSVRPTSCEVN